MKTAKLMLATTALPLVLALAACSHNSDTAGGPGSPALTPGKTIAQSTSDTASNLLSGDGDTAGATLETTAVTSSAYQTTFADGTEENPHTGQAIPPPTFSIKKNGSGAVDMTVNGQTVSFAASGLVDNEGWEKYTDPDNTYEGSLWTHSANTASEAIDGTDTNYLQVWNYDVEKDGKAIQGYAVVGAETDPEIVKAQTAQATYKGWARADLVLAADTDLRVDVRTNDGLTMNADFAAREVSGKLENLQVRSRDHSDTWTAWADTGGTVLMGTSSISSNGFSGGTLSATDLELPDPTTPGDVLAFDPSGSTYSGRFYGPAAEQVGGVFDIKGNVGAAGAVVGAGYFAGDKQP